MLVFKKENFVDFLLFFYFTIGSTVLIPYIDIVIGLTLSLYVVLKGQSIYLKYIIIAFLFLLYSSIFYNVLFIDIISRLSKILSLYIVFVTIGSSYVCRSVDNVVKCIFLFYKILGVVIIVDAVFFFILGYGIWPPQEYFGMRFSGPFFDANFLSLFYGILFLYTFRNKCFVKMDAIVSLTVVLLSLSWSAIFFIGVSYFLHRALTKQMALNQIIVFLIYISSFFLIISNMELLRECFIDICSYVFDVDTKLLNIKFASLEGRFESQSIVFSFGLIDLLWGHGPLSILDFMPRDTHNSYLGYAFEMGFINLFFLLGLFFFSKKVVNNYFILRSSLFFILMGLVLNVHYTIAYPLIFLLSYKQVFLYK